MATSFYAQIDENTASKKSAFKERKKNKKFGLRPEFWKLPLTLWEIPHKKSNLGANPKRTEKPPA
jgi:hypothetical protein